VFGLRKLGFLIGADSGSFKKTCNQGFVVVFGVFWRFSGFVAAKTV